MTQILSQLSSTNNLFNQLEDNLGNQEQAIGMICHNIRPLRQRNLRSAITHTTVFPQPDIQHLVLKEAVTRFSRNIDSIEKCPAWIIQEVGRNSENKDSYLGLVQGDVQDKPEGEELKTFSDTVLTPRFSKVTDINRCMTKQWCLGDTVLKNDPFQNFNYAHGRPTRTTLLRAQMSYDRIPINSYDVHRQRIAKLAEIYKRRTLATDLKELLQNYTHQNHHSFLSGARYNRSKYLDAMCFEKWGMYLLRSDSKISVIVPSLSRIIRQLESEDQLPAAPPESPDVLHEEMKRVTSAPASIRLHTQEEASDSETGLHINEPSMTTNTRSLMKIKHKECMKTVLPSVSGISWSKFASQPQLGDQTDQLNAHDGTVTRESSPSGFLSPRPDTHVEGPPLRRKKHRSKPVMVDKAINFPPTAKEADETDRKILGDVIIEDDIKASWARSLDVLRAPVEIPVDYNAVSDSCIGKHATTEVHEDPIGQNSQTHNTNQITTSDRAIRVVVLGTDSLATDASLNAPFTSLKNSDISLSISDDLQNTSKATIENRHQPNVQYTRDSNRNKDKMPLIKTNAKVERHPVSAPLQFATKKDKLEVNKKVIFRNVSSADSSTSGSDIKPEIHNL